ncbi:hypothetical protein BGW38_007424 [Lunasporangiospora selenospora]|uniref:Septation initiation network scaffold protein cdc11 n=1 Tax=Lunasporangiospora selenospora TaxID=979761 RepID=A0A9P6FZ81_9FUNG|nr:hypothetical protein BGW38_007424 [Lunasporangiospora selenospora]
MLRAAHSAVEPRPMAIGRSSPSLQLTMSGSSPSLSSSSLKEKRLQQLQSLQQQQGLYMKQKLQSHSHALRLHKDRSPGVSAVAETTVGQTRGNEMSLGQERTLERDLEHDEDNESSWVSQELRDPWVRVDDNENERRAELRSDRRHSRMSEKPMNNGHMKLLSDETPPDVMDGIWGLDDMDDDHLHQPPRGLTQFSRLTNDERHVMNINDHSSDHQGEYDNKRTYKSQVHGYAHMDNEIPSMLHHYRGHSGNNAAFPSQATEGVAGGAEEVKESPTTGGGKSLTARNRADSSSAPMNRPWRESKIEDLFADEHDKLPGTPLSQSSKALECSQKEIQGHETGLPMSHQLQDDDDWSFTKHLGLESGVQDSKYLEARRLFTEVPLPGQLLADPAPVSNQPVDTMNDERTQDRQDIAHNPVAGISAQANILTAYPQKYLPPSQRRVSGGDPSHDVRSGGQERKIRTARPYSNRAFNAFPQSSRSSRFSFGSRHRPQSSRDAETGDRGSTTSRDSAYRDSLSGSTLGPTGFHNQLDGINNHMPTIESVQKDYPTTGSTDHPGSVSGGMLQPINTNFMSKLHPTSIEDALLKRHLLSPAASPVHRLADVAVHQTETCFQGTLTLAPQSGHEDDLAAQFRYPQKGGYTELQTNWTNGKSATIMGSSPGVAPIIPIPGKFRPPLTLTTKSGVEAPPVMSWSNGDIMAWTPLSEVGEDVNSISDMASSTFPMESPKSLKDEEKYTDKDIPEPTKGLASRQWSLELALKSLEHLNDIPLDETFNLKGPDGQMWINRETAYMALPQGDDEQDAPPLTVQSLKARLGGQYSLRWENQPEAQSETDSPRDPQNGEASEPPGLFPQLVPRSDSPQIFSEEILCRLSREHLLDCFTTLFPLDEWDMVKSADLSERTIESILTLEEIAPNLEKLNLDKNQIRYLTGIPSSVKSMLARSNLLGPLTSFGRLVNLQYLDISHNKIEDLKCLSGLVHLRELIAKDNKINSISALQQLDGLIKLDVSNNLISIIDLQTSNMVRLEYLNASHNEIQEIDGLESLTGLIHINLAHNCISTIGVKKPHRSLRVLRLSENRLATFDAASFPGLRTLYLDDNRLHTLMNCHRLTRLESFSARDQEGEGIDLAVTEFVNSRKLYLSGNPIHALDFEMGFYRLEYLEIQAGCLTELPVNFAALFPNLRGLDLSYNGLTSILALEGLHRLKRLIFVGNKLGNIREICDIVKNMRSLSMIDFRHNLLTSNMYPAMSVSQGSKYQDSYRSSHGGSAEKEWLRRDIVFRRALQDEICKRRAVYRAAILKTCRGLMWFDGGVIPSREREGATIRLEDMLVPNQLDDEVEMYLDGAEDYLHESLAHQPMTQSYRHQGYFSDSADGQAEDFVEYNGHNMIGRFNRGPAYRFPLLPWIIAVNNTPGDPIQCPSWETISMGSDLTPPPLQVCVSKA